MPLDIKAMEFLWLSAGLDRKQRDARYHGEWCSDKLRQLPPLINSKQQCSWCNYPPTVVAHFLTLNFIFRQHYKHFFSLSRSDAIPGCTELYSNVTNSLVLGVRNELCAKCRCVLLSHEHSIYTCATYEWTLNDDMWNMSLFCGWGLGECFWWLSLVGELWLAMGRLSSWLLASGNELVKQWMLIHPKA